MKANVIQMTVEEYLKLPYALDIAWDSDDEIFVARVAEIPECSGHGASRAEAMDMALDNLRDWIEEALEAGEAIPQPVPIPELPSGKWLQRVPRTVHAELVVLAARDGVSLNQLVVSILSRELGYRSGTSTTETLSLAGSVASMDPSSTQWRSMLEEIAVNQSWKIRDLAKPHPLDEAYLNRLVTLLPQKSKEENLDLKTYGEDFDHKNWN